MYNSIIWPEKFEFTTEIKEVPQVLVSTKKLKIISETPSIPRISDKSSTSCRLGNEL